MKIIKAESQAHFETGRALFREYAASLNVDLCFQNFEDELKDLNIQYGPPSGCLLLAFEEDMAAGCVAVRSIEPSICEMKRLYVREQYRGRGHGRLLAEAIIKEGASIGYEKIRLDTLPGMESARALYRSLGFVEIDAYRHNPVGGTLYMELTMTEPAELAAKNSD